MGDFGVFLCANYENVTKNVSSLTIFFDKLHTWCLWKKKKYKRNNSQRFGLKSDKHAAIG